jgi:retron-type reverse transcriptase
MVGYKGCAPGGALTAMGTRSTLLRLDATFGVDKAKKTTMAVKKKADLTSIIDVVIGQGQDSAVANDEQPKKKAKKA